MLIAEVVSPDPPATICDRDRELRLMLTCYPEARAEAFGGAGSGGRPTSRYLSFDSRTWTSAYRELDRCLDRLRWLAGHDRPILERGVSASAAWWHVRERFLHARVVRRDVHTERTHSGERRLRRLPANAELAARPTLLHGRTSSVLLRVWDPHVDPACVDVGVRWIGGVFVGDPDASYRADDAA